MVRDLVYLIWKDVNTGNKYKVATLYKENGKFYFKYILENVKEAQKVGLKLLVAFPQINATYEKPQLFANFATRLPNENRPEIKEILEIPNVNISEQRKLVNMHMKNKVKRILEKYSFLL